MENNKEDKAFSAVTDAFVKYMRTPAAQAADAALKKQRATYNKLILKRLQSYLDKNPDIRFTQALHNLDIIMMGDPMPKTGLSFPKDTFYEEPVVTSERVEKAIKKLN